MYCLHKRYLAIIPALAALISYFLILTSVSKAATTTLNAVINPGSLTVTNSSVASISAVTLEGVSQSSTGSLGPITVTDNRGTGAGWSVTMTVSDFTCCEPVRTIPSTNLTVNPGSVNIVSGKSVGVSAGESHTVSSATDPVTLMTAIADSGLGSYRVTPNITLSIPGDAYAGTYTATVTVTII